MDGVNYALGMRFFMRITNKPPKKFEIPEDFKEHAIHELGDKKNATLRVRNKIYRCKIAHVRDAVYIAGESIVQLAKDFKLSDGDVLFFEYLGNAYFACVVCCGYTYMEKKAGTGCQGTPVRFFVEAISHHGLDFPDLMFSNVSKDFNSFCRVQTRRGSWSIKVKFGNSWSMLGGKCWESFYKAHDLRSSSLIQMDYHGSGNFTATVFKMQSRCEQPFKLNGMIFVKVEEGSDGFNCLCNGVRPARVSTSLPQAPHDEDEEDPGYIEVLQNGFLSSYQELDEPHGEDAEDDHMDESDGEDVEDGMDDELPLPEDVLDNWKITTRKHMIPDFCKKTLPRMYLPADKWKKHQIDRKTVAVLSVPDYDEQRWEVHIRPYKNNGETTRVALTQGWSKFAEDNFLRIGESIEFNLLRPPVHEPINGSKIYMSMFFV